MLLYFGMSHKIETRIISERCERGDNEAFLISLFIINLYLNVIWKWKDAALIDLIPHE